LYFTCLLDSVIGEPNSRTWLFTVIWFLAILIVVLLAIVSIAFRKFLAVAGIIAGILICVAVVAFWVYSEQQKQEDKLARTRISPQDVELTDLELRGSEITGKLKNKSAKYSVSEIELRITIKDCVGDNCEIIAQSNESIWLDVPPGQVRFFEEYVSLPKRGKPTGETKWYYDILSIRAN